MPGCRTLSPFEERRFLAAARRASPRDRLVVTLMLFAGLRSSELLRLKVGDIWRDNSVVSHLEIPSHALRHQQGMRQIPVSPEVRRATESFFRSRQERRPDAPLVTAEIPRHAARNMELNRREVHRIVRKVFRRARLDDDGRMGVHILRKTFGRRIYELTNADVVLARDALGHGSIITTQEYLEVNRPAVVAAVLGGSVRRSDIPRWRPSSSLTAHILFP
jgi:integrase